MSAQLKYTNLTANILTEADIANVMTLDGGGEVSADVGIVQHNLFVLSGNFSGGIGAVATGVNSFAYGTDVSAIGENSYAIGKDTVAGCYGWYYKYLDLTTGTFYLTTEQPDVRKISDMGPEPEVDTSFESGFAVGDVISYVNKSKLDMYATITGINGNRIVVGQLNDSENTLEEEHPNHDDWTIFVPEKPEAGEIWLGECAFAEGSDSKAINAYSHAEGGRGCFAYGQYSHAEGKATKAGYASHAEGADTDAFGHYAHAEGQTTKAYGNKSHAEGTQSETHANNSHVEGYSGKIMDGSAAHVEGYGNVIDINEETDVTTTTAEGQSIGGHVEGLSNKGAGIAVHVEGRGNVGNAEAVHVEGYNNIASGKAAHAEGNRTRAGSLEKPAEDVTSTEGIYTHAEGNSTLAKGSASHAEGAGTQALGRATHAEGRHAVALGNYAHAEGFDTFAGVPTTAVPRPTTTNNTSAGFFTHSEGHHTLAQGNSSHAEGKETITQNQSEHAEGQFNKSNMANANFGNAGNTIHSIGIGTSDSNRKNAIEVMQNGKIYIKDAGGYNGTNPTGSGVKDLATVIGNLATISYVDGKYNEANSWWTGFIQGGFEALKQAHFTDNTYALPDPNAFAANPALMAATIYAMAASIVIAAKPSTNA